jgi:lipid-binding SYLF domain-containing protein
MRKLVAVFVVLVVGAVYSVAQKPESKSKELERVQAASKVLDEIMATPDKGIPQEVLSAADCAVIIPSMLKAGFVVGGRYGKGVATCRTKPGGANTWSAPAPVAIEGGSWGLQIGGEAIDLVMLVMNQKGAQHLLQSKFKIGADASGAAGPIGRHTEASTDWKMRSEILSYSRSRGAFAGVTLNGAVVKQDTDDTLALYGKYVPFNQILTGKVAAPAGTQTFIADVRRHFGQAKAATSESAQKSAPSRSTRTQAQGGTSGAATSGAGATPSGTQPGSVAGPTQQTTQATGTTTETTESTGAQTGAVSSSASSDQVRSNIENALRNAPNLSTSNVNVSVTNDQVVLGGSVPNQADKATIRRLAEQNSAGRKVVDDGLVVK